MCRKMNRNRLLNQMDHIKVCNILGLENIVYNWLEDQSGVRKFVGLDYIQAQKKKAKGKGKEPYLDCTT